MKYLAGLKITDAQFDALRTLCSGDHDFPKSWSEWSELVAKAHELASEEGLLAAEILLDIKHFEGWCRMVGIVPCIDALRAYAIVMRTLLDDAKRVHS